MNTVGPDNQRGVATILIITIVALLCLAAGMWIWQSQQPPRQDNQNTNEVASPSLSSVECEERGGVVVNTLDSYMPFSYSSEDVLGTVTGMRCPCICVRKPTSDETSEWQTYRNEEYGFEVMYPSEFILGRAPEKTFYLVSEKGEISIDIKDGPLDWSHARTLYDEVPNPKELLIGGRPAYSYTLGDGGCSAVIFLVTISQDKTGEIVFSGCYDPLVESSTMLVEDSEIIDQILSTFKFISQ